jgi:hypothetical protein
VRDAIVDKLRGLLLSPIDSECKVVYLLAECRKLLEKYPPNPVPFALKLYCHWALHVNLEHPSTTRLFLERVERHAESVLNGTTDFWLEHEMVREFVFLETFREQLKQLLLSYDIPTNLCDETERWHEFLLHYAGVIEDGSLSCITQRQPLRLVKEVVFTKGRGIKMPDSYLPFGLAWTIFLLDGRTLTVEVTARLFEGKEMIGCVATLH